MGSLWYIYMGKRWIPNHDKIGFWILIFIVIKTIIVEKKILLMLYVNPCAYGKEQKCNVANIVINNMIINQYCFLINISIRSLYADQYIPAE